MTRVAGIKVIFVCLGNICRSPTAHGVLRAQIERADLAGRIKIDSAGTGDWHIGGPPDPRARATARSHGIEIGDLRARQVVPADLMRFDEVVAMDARNEADLRALAAAHAATDARITLFTDWCDGVDTRSGVPDPYGGGADGFERVFSMIENGCRGLLDRVKQRLDM